MAQDNVLEIINSVLTRMRPMIQGDGGDIEFINYENNIVYVKLHGACVHCPVSMFTLKLGIEESLKAEIPDLKEVIAIE